MPRRPWIEDPQRVRREDPAAAPAPPSARAAPEVLRGAAIKLALLVGFLLAVGWNGYLLLLQWALDLNDLGKFYYDTRAFLEGQEMYAPSPATSIPVSPDERREFLNMNPPHFHLLILPLALLPPAAAFGVWLSTGLFALGATAAAALREAALEARASAGWLAVWILFALSEPFGSNMVTGQIAFHLMPLVAWAWIAARRGRERQLGVALGLAIAIKPFLGLFLPWLLLCRRFEALGFAIGAGVASLALGFAVFGVETHLAWIDALGTVDWHWASMNASLYGFLDRVLGLSPHYTPLWLAEAAIAPLWLAGSALIGAGTFASLFVERDRADSDRAFALLLSAALLISPLGWVYYLPLAAPPAIAHFATRQRGGPGWLPLERGLLAAAVGLLMLPHIVLWALAEPAPATATLGSAYFWGLLALWALLLRPRSEGVPT